MSIYNKILLMICFLLVCFCIHETRAEDGWKLIFQDDFENGLQRSNWIFNGGDIGLMDRDTGSKCAQINRNDEFGETYLIREFRGPGRYRFEALIYAKDVRGGGPTWTAGQFNAAIVAGGKEIAWRSDQFSGSFGFTKKAFETGYLPAGYTAKLRIGIQDGTGTICVDDVKVFKWSDL